MRARTSWVRERWRKIDLLPARVFFHLIFKHSHPLKILDQVTFFKVWVPKTKKRWVFLPVTRSESHNFWWIDLRGGKSEQDDIYVLIIVSGCFQLHKFWKGEPPASQRHRKRRRWRKWAWGFFRRGGTTCSYGRGWYLDNVLGLWCSWSSPF